LTRQPSLTVSSRRSTRNLWQSPSPLHIETYQNPKWGQESRERALAGIRYLDEALGKQPYLAGELFTVADITAFAGLAFADFAKIDIPADLANLRAWRTRVAERPSMAQAF
jgi:glutathione S-transferase